MKQQLLLTWPACLLNTHSLVGTIKPHSLPLDIDTAMADKVADLQQRT